MIAIDTSVVVGRQKEGLGIYLNHVLAELQEVAPQGKLLVVMPSCHRDIFPLDPARVEICALPNFLNGPLWNILWSAVGLPFLLKWKRASVFHLPDARRVLLWKPCPVVTTVHDLVNWQVQQRVGPLRKLYHRLIRRRLIRQSDLYVTVSANTRKDMREQGFDESRVRVIPNGVAPAFRPRPPEECRRALAAYALPEKFVLCVSRLEHPQKNHVTLIRAWERLCGRLDWPYQLVLVGKKWWNWEVVMDEIRRRKIEDRIRYVDFVESDELPYFYSAAAAFVYPSLYEGFGLPVVEAMASGTPVVASDSSSIREYFREGALLFPPTDDAALAERLLEALSPEKGAQLIQSGLETARRFSWRRSAADHLRVYEELLK